MKLFHILGLAATTALTWNTLAIAQDDLSHLPIAKTVEELEREAGGTVDSAASSATSQASDALETQVKSSNSFVVRTKRSVAESTQEQIDAQAARKAAEAQSAIKAKGEADRAAAQAAAKSAKQRAEEMKAKEEEARKAAKLVVTDSAQDTRDAEVQDAISSKPCCTPRSVNPGAYKHDGLMVRMIGGVAVGAIKETSTGDDLSLTGQGGTFGLSVGGIIAENLALHADFIATGLINPNITFQGGKYETSETRVGLGGIGVGLTYWAMPINIFVSPVIGLADNDIEYRIAPGDVSRVEDKPGLFFSFTTGKEWWIEEDFALGVMLNVMYARSHHDRSDILYRGLSASIGASLTYN